MFQAMLWVGVLFLILITVIELWFPNTINEGFDQLVSVGDSDFWAKFVPRRGDIGDSIEEAGYIKDDRYFHGYADIQRLGVKHDFCRMVTKKSDPTDMFFACALGGTEGLTSLAFRTESTKQGFEVSRDDYMNRLNDGRDAYCHILKIDEFTFESRCNEARDTKFSKNNFVDTTPPPRIQLLLRAYEGIMFWLRLRDDMLDYAKNLTVFKAGGMEIEEFPPLPPTEGARTLEFNGIDQFLRIGDGKNLEFGDAIELRYLRTVSFWVYFEEFTNNAHIFDFGNGAGKDNVWCGIVGRGNEQAQMKPLRDLVCGKQDSTVPEAPSGAQPAETVTPEELMRTSSANVDEFTCPKAEIFGRIMPPIQPFEQPAYAANTADLVYEIWDHQQIKMHIKVPDAIPLRKWTHIVITTRNADSFRPDIDFYRNGEKIYTEMEGWLPQTSLTTNNYIGKSNWSAVTKQYENADELFKGKMFDFRGYRTPMATKKVQETYQWGKDLLGLPTTSKIA